MYYNQNLQYNMFPTNDNANMYNAVNSCFCFKSYFRVFNAIIGSPALDIYVNELLLAANLKYGEFSRYLKFMPGEYRVTAYPSGNQKKAILETNIVIGKNLVYTGALTGQINNIEDLSILMIPDEKVNQFMNGMSAVKVINLIPGSVSYDLVAEDGTVLFSDIKYGDISIDVAIPSGRYKLYLRKKGDDKNLLTVPSIDFAPRMYYKLFIIGEHDETPKIEMIIPEDGLNYLDLC